LSASATLIGGIGSGILGRLVSSGTQRIGTLIFQKVVRTFRIEAALRGDPVKNPSIQKAISDFETVVGSRYGKLTQQLDDFLRELERSGIINSIAENAMLGLHPVLLTRT
jgi:hypothetical protein